MWGILIGREEGKSYHGKSGHDQDGWVKLTPQLEAFHEVINNCPQQPSCAVILSTQRHQFFGGRRVGGSVVGVGHAAHDTRGEQGKGGLRNFFFRKNVRRRRRAAHNTIGKGE